VVNPTGFPYFHSRSEGGKGEVTFSLRPRRGRSLAPPFPPAARRRLLRPRRSGFFSFCFFFFFVQEVGPWVRE